MFAKKSLGVVLLLTVFAVYQLWYGAGYALLSPETESRVRVTARATYIDGGITDETEDAFEVRPLVVLSSPGGNPRAAMAIGRRIREAGATTVVLRGAACGSACALIWVAGQHRVLEGAVLFHAPGEGTRDRLWTEKNYEYFDELGLSRRFAAWAMSAPPWDANRLTPRLAMQLGIAIEQM
jgi:hypothetical protein